MSHVACRLTDTFFWGAEDEATIKVASKKNPSVGKAKQGGFKLKLKEKIPKLKEAGTQDANILEGAQSPPSPSPKIKLSSTASVINQLTSMRDNREEIQSEYRQ